MANIPEDPYKPEAEFRTGPRILIITANKVNDLEFFYPYYRFIEEGLYVDIATPKGGEFKGDSGTGLKSSKKLEDIDPNDYRLLYIPGGKAPAKLKDDEDAIRITKQFFEDGKPIAAFCHGPQVLAAAGVLQDRRIAAWPEIQDEIEEAGAEFIDEETVVDGQFITGRYPADLPSYTATVLENLDAEMSKAA